MNKYTNIDLDVDVFECYRKKQHWWIHWIYPSIHFFFSFIWVLNILQTIYLYWWIICGNFKRGVTRDNLCDLNSAYKKHVARIRLSSHILANENRWLTNVPKERLLCKFLSDIKDKFHFVLICRQNKRSIIGIKNFLFSNLYDYYVSNFKELYNL